MAPKLIAALCCAVAGGGVVGRDAGGAAGSTVTVSGDVAHSRLDGGDGRRAGSGDGSTALRRRAAHQFQHIHGSTAATRAPNRTAIRQDRAAELQRKLDDFSTLRWQPELQQARRNVSRPDDRWMDALHQELRRTLASHHFRGSGAEGPHHAFKVFAPARTSEASSEACRGTAAGAARIVRGAVALRSGSSAGQRARPRARAPPRARRSCTAS